MSSDLGAIRHALALARDRGFAEVVVEEGDLKFRAALEVAPKKRATNGVQLSQVDSGEEPIEPDLAEVVSPTVGYFREADPVVAIGDSVTVGQVVGIVASLGDIPYAVESAVEGEVVAMLVEPGQPVMFGQPILQVKS